MNSVTYLTYLSIGKEKENLFKQPVKKLFQEPFPKKSWDEKK